MSRKFFEHIYDNPIIATISDLKQIDDVIKSPCKIVFMLTGDILNIKEVVDQLKENEKLVYLHVDLIGGLSRDSKAIEYICKNIKPDGIITTKTNIIRAAKDLGMFTIQRLFLLDSLAIQSGIHAIQSGNPDLVEVLPGIMPEIVKEINKEIRAPIITGGLIRNKDNIINSLNAGAVGVSVSEKELWYM